MEPKITKYKNGNIHRIEYFNDNGKRHRTDGPAYKSFFENIYYESYWINGKKHRIDGPSKIWYDENGNIIFTEYWLNGKELTKQKFILHNRKRKLEIINGTENN